MVRLAVTGRQSREWQKALYEGHEDELRRSANWARVVVLFNAFGAVPCYHLRKLHKTVAADMPKPRDLKGRDKALEAAMGDLAPKVLEE